MENGGINLYGFVFNNPVAYIDSDGMFILDDDGFPVLPIGTALDSYFYDRDTKDAHDEIMREGARQLSEAGKEISMAGICLLPGGGLARAAGPLKAWLRLGHLTVSYCNWKLGGRYDGDLIVITPKRLEI
jgi:hypothetical protein